MGWAISPGDLLPLSLHGIVYYVAYNLINFFDMHFKLRVRRAAAATNHRCSTSFIASTTDNLEGAEKLLGY